MDFGPETAKLIGKQLTTDLYVLTDHTVRKYVGCAYHEPAEIRTKIDANGMWGPMLW